MWRSGRSPRSELDGERLDTSSRKMSKSKSNGVDPAVVIDRYGLTPAPECFILFQSANREKDLSGMTPMWKGQFRCPGSDCWRLVETACNPRTAPAEHPGSAATASTPAEEGTAPGRPRRHRRGSTTIWPPATNQFNTAVLGA